MKVHVVGSGGREHALRTVLARTAQVVNDIDSADLVVIGPEGPLVDGLADQLRSDGKLVYGPGREGAQLEGSKAWMKDFVARAGVPTARYGNFKEAAPAIAFLQTMPTPYVIKTDGLAAGKGVFITDSFDDAVADVRSKLSGKSFAGAGRTVVIEEAMSGPELSLLYVFDGKNGVALPMGQDFKRLRDGDDGPNTGGMGAYSAVPIATDAVLDTVMDLIIEPTCGRLRKESIDYRGTLFAGLMLTDDGPKLLEYNVRFGDPETQVVVPRFDGDFAETLASAAHGSLTVHGNVAGQDQAVTVALVSANYPESSSQGDVITGVADANAIDGVTVFEAGTSTNAQGQLVTNGGRVLNVTGMAPTLREARRRAYEGIKRINFRGMQFRTDIGLTAAEGAP